MIVISQIVTQIYDFFLRLNPVLTGGVTGNLLTVPY